MSCNSPFCLTLIRKTLPIYYPSSTNLVTPFFHSHPQFLPFNGSALPPSLLSGDSPDFPKINPFPPPSFPLEIPQFSPPPEIEPSTPTELPSITPEPGFPPPPPGPEFPKPPLPSPPGIEVPMPPHKPPDIEPPRPGSPMPGPDILPPRPSGPEIVTSPSPPGFAPPMSN